MEGMNKAIKEENMCKISVLMSIYNESLSDIKKSVDSMINQTFRDIEIIIVSDNPQRKDLESFIEGIGDSRIKFIENKENIGLAMSMNVAANTARGEFLARMDADDISNVTRFEKTLEFMRKNELDYACTEYKFIDENDNIVERNIRKFDNKTIGVVLPYCNPIHHPTVMMKKSCFEAVGGYRDFPCAQDYDLWLRLHDKGYKVGIVEEVLLQYRIRSGSVTNKKRVQQFYTQVYARKLSKERKESLNDTYSMENYEKFMKKNRVYDQDYKDEIESLRAQKDKEGKLYPLYLIIKNKYFRDYYVVAVKSRLLQKIKGI